MRLPLLFALLFATMFTTGKAAMAIDFGDLGLPFSLNFGPNNSVIKRQWDGKREPQTIKVGTDYWTTNGKDRIDKGNVFLHPNGTLSINKFGPDDVASYTMPDEPLHYRGQGIVGPSMIVVRLRDD